VLAFVKQLLAIRTLLRGSGRGAGGGNGEGSGGGNRGSKDHTLIGQAARGSEVEASSLAWYQVEHSCESYKDVTNEYKEIVIYYGNSCCNRRRAAGHQPLTTSYCFPLFCMPAVSCPRLRRALILLL
jgi:hypothetical protein